MRRVVLGAVVTPFFAAAAIDTSVAQTADSDGLSLQEIIVTAQRRPENVNTVPIVMTVLTNQDLIQTGIGSTQQMEWATPGLVFGNTNGVAEPYIRGIGTDLLSPGQESPVGFYLDGVYLPLSSSILQEFGDVSRIEVLKGPQGTLYGRNTTAGAVNIITRDPEHTFSADGTLSAGNLGYAKAVTYVTGGLTNDLSANFAGVYTIHNGFFDVLNTGGHLDSLDQFGLRGKIKYRINEDWDVLFSGDYENKNDSSDTVYSPLLGTDIPGVIPAPLGTRNLYTILDPAPYRSATDFGANLTVRGHMRWADFTAISGFREDYLVSLSDGSETLQPLLAYQSFEGEQQFTQEIHLTSVGASPLQWIGGLYVLKGNAFEGPLNVWAGVPITSPETAALLDGRTRISSYAVFGQAGYQLPYGFSLIGGFRTTYEQRKLTGQTSFADDLLVPAVRAAMTPPLAPIDTSISWTTTKPKATVQWEHPGQLLYATYSTAFKAGSYNLISASSPGPLAPENIKAYEVGGKHDLSFLNHGHVNWAAFYYNYTDIQVATQEPGVQGIAASQNAASSISRGVDLDLAVPVIRNLTATIGMEYLDARYESFPNAQVANIVDGALATATPIGYEKSVNASGNRAERSPLLTSTLQVEWLVPLSPGNLSTTATYYHNSGFFFDPGDETQQRAYNLVNLHVQYAPQGNRWSIAAWVDNAFNATVLGGIAASPYVLGGFYNDPRLFGLTASVHY